MEYWDHMFSTWFKKTGLCAKQTMDPNTEFMCLCHYSIIPIFHHAMSSVVTLIVKNFIISI